MWAKPAPYQGGWAYWGDFTPVSNAQAVSYSFHPRVSAVASVHGFKYLGNYRDYNLGASVVLLKMRPANGAIDVRFNAFGGWYHREPALAYVRHWDWGVEPPESPTKTKAEQDKPSLNEGFGANPHGFVWRAQLETDWQSPRAYTALRGEVFTVTGDTRRYYGLTGRVGLAPYVGGQDSLHSWLVLQFRHWNHWGQPLSLTPMLRFLYRNILWEVGANLKGRFFLSLNVHY